MINSTLTHLACSSHGHPLFCKTVDSHRRREDKLAALLRIAVNTRHLKTFLLICHNFMEKSDCRETLASTCAEANYRLKVFMDLWGTASSFISSYRCRCSMCLLPGIPRTLAMASVSKDGSRAITAPWIPLPWRLSAYSWRRKHRNECKQLGI